MIYKRLSRGELLKAIQDHARLVSSDNGGGIIEWKDDLDCYCLSMNGTRIFIDKFQENPIMHLIAMFRVIKVNAYDLSFDVMLGVIDSTDWMAELPEEGEE